MGERKGQNKYYPPDFDPKKHGNLNRYHGTHALRERASKIHLGILTIRFEMPFNIWCLGCENHVGMGVRYNAEKKKVGMYYTTPIYEFRMKCHLCDNYFEIRTDPKNFDYELVTGCRRQEKRWDPGEHGGFAVDREASQKLASDAMFKLEHGANDEQKLKSSAPQLEQIEMIQSRMYDDFAANQALRRSFREKRKDLKRQAVVDDELRQKSSLGDLVLLPESQDDRKMASLLAKYRTVQSVEEKQVEKRKLIQERPIFVKKVKKIQDTSSTPSTSSASSKSSKSSSDKEKESRIDELRKSLSLSVKKKKMEESQWTGFDASSSKSDTTDKLIRTDKKLIRKSNDADSDDKSDEFSKEKDSNSIQSDGLRVLGAYGSDTSDSD